MINNGEPQRGDGTGQAWQVGDYRFKAQRGPDGTLWGVSARGLGVGGYRSPVRALIAHAVAAGLPWYRLPGYGSAYRAVQAALHRRGFCVLRHHDMPGPHWRCSWCGNHVGLSKQPNVPSYKDWYGAIGASPADDGP